MERKKLTNIIGLVVLAAFVVAVVITGAVRHARKLAESQQALKVANEVASGFATKDAKVVIRWANGQYADPWKGQIVLLANEKTGVQLASKGPDGELGTPDDIKSQIFVPKVETPKPKKLAPPEPHKIGLLERIRRHWTKANPDAQK